MNDRKYKFLCNSVYHTFKTDILPILPVKDLSKYFHESIGRKTKDIQSIIGLFIFQAMFDLTDIQAVEAYTFDQKFHYALDIKEKDAYLSIRSFFYYKNIILGSEQIVFDKVLLRIKDVLDFDFSIQRTDSTLVGLNLKKMSQWELFKSTLIKFLHELKANFPRIYTRVPNHIQNYLKEDEKNSWFTGFSPSKANDYLIQAAKDILTLKETFEKHPKVSKLETFQLVLRLFAEQVRIKDDDIEVKLKEECKGSAMVNPHDPEAQYNGHKKKAGIKATVSESCSADEETENPQIITNIDVQLANVSDQEILEPSIDERNKKGVKPDTELTDNGFESDANHQALQSKGVDLISPPNGEPPDGFGVIDFALDGDGQRIIRCPLGQQCQSNKVNHKAKKTTSYFDKSQCEACAHKEACPVQLTKRKARLVWKWNKPRLEAKRLAFQGDQELIRQYRKRSGGEAAISQLKNSHGLRRLRIRGYAKSKCRTFFAVIALNIRRFYNTMKRQGLIMPSSQGLKKILFPAHFICPKLCSVEASMRALAA
jgi:hypothetical protein